MKQRNFVAKYSQRSGAGKHKEKRMSTIDKEDWIYYENYKDEVDWMKTRIAELEEVVENQDHAEIFILAKMIGMRETAIKEKAWGVVGKLDYVIGLHSATVYVKAKELYEKDKELNA